MALPRYNGDGKASGLLLPQAFTSLSQSNDSNLVLNNPLGKDWLQSRCIKIKNDRFNGISTPQRIFIVTPSLERLANKANKAP